METFACPYPNCGESKASRNGIKKHLKNCPFKPEGVEVKFTEIFSKGNISCYGCEKKL